MCIGAVRDVRFDNERLLDPKAFNVQGGATLGEGQLAMIARSISSSVGKGKVRNMVSALTEPSLLLRAAAAFCRQTRMIKETNLDSLLLYYRVEWRV
jgi:hypothetical protein